MLIKVKYIGTGEGGAALTLNSVYTVIAFPGFASQFTLLDDNGSLYQTSTIFGSTANWQLVSIETVGAVQIYP